MILSILGISKSVFRRSNLGRKLKRLARDGHSLPFERNRMPLLLPVHGLIKTIHDNMDRPWHTVAQAWLDRRSTTLTELRSWTYITPRLSDIRELFEIYEHDYQNKIQRIHLKTYPHRWVERRWDGHVYESIVLPGDVGL